MLAGLSNSAATLKRCRTEKLLFFSLNVLDLFLTVSAVSLGLNELNPWMRYLLSSPVQLIAFKVALPFFIAWMVPGKLLIPAIVLLLFVVGWDIKELVLFAL